MVEMSTAVELPRNIQISNPHTIFKGMFISYNIKLYVAMEQPTTDIIAAKIFSRIRVIIAKNINHGGMPPEEKDTPL